LLLWLLTGRWRRGLAWAAVAVAALALGAARMHGVTSPVLPAAHVARLRLPLATTLEGRIVAAPERRAGRTVLLVEAEAVGRGAARRPVCGLVRLALRHPARRWRYGERLRALIGGDEEGIDADLREVFTRAGVVHVLSISGLHVGLVAAAGFALARLLLGRSERLLLAVDVERLAALLSLGPVALYTALAGLGVATLRSALMVAAAVLAGPLGRRRGGVT